MIDRRRTMIPSIARQSVIIKCNQQKSVLLGNYEFYYLGGLFNKLFDIQANKDMKPKELFDHIAERLDDLAPKDEKEAYLIKIVRFYRPLEEYDDQMRYLFAWGEQEPNLWQVETTYLPTE
jgi:hypothetical protein